MAQRDKRTGERTQRAHRDAAREPTAGGEWEPDVASDEAPRAARPRDGAGPQGGEPQRGRRGGSEAFANRPRALEPAGSHGDAPTERRRPALPAAARRVDHRDRDAGPQIDSRDDARRRPPDDDFDEQRLDAAEDAAAEYAFDASDDEPDDGREREFGSGARRMRVGPIRSEAIDAEDIAALYRDAEEQAGRRTTSAYVWRRRMLRFGLPVAAASILAMIFLSSGSGTGPAGLSIQEAVNLQRGNQVRNPRISGATGNGEPFTLRVDIARPDGPDPEFIALEGVEGSLEMAGGRIVTLTANTGLYAAKADELTLSDDVRITTSDGYVMRADALRSDIEAGTLESDGWVAGSGPVGALTAGALRISNAEGGRAYFDECVVVTLNPTSAPPELAAAPAALDTANPGLSITQPASADAVQAAVPSLSVPLTDPCAARRALLAEFE